MRNSVTHWQFRLGIAIRCGFSFAYAVDDERILSLQDTLECIDIELRLEIRGPDEKVAKKNKVR